MSLYNIQDSQAPFLLLQGCNSILLWDEGVLLSRRLLSSAMQISATTMQLYNGPELLFSRNWGVFDCSATTNALCLSANTNVALFGTVPVTTPRDVRLLMPRSELLQRFNGAVCNSGRTGRSSGDGDVYTVSMCDLVEGALRFVITQEGLVYWIRDTTGIAEQLLLSMIALYAASNLAQNLSSLMSTNVAAIVGMSKLLNLVACVICVITLLVMCETHREYYVSKQDVDLYQILLLFLSSDVILMGLKATGPPDRSKNFGYQIGLSTTLLLLVTLRLHNTFNTPFFFVLVGIFGTRTACKIMQHLYDSLLDQARNINLVSVILDLGTWCCLLAYSLAQCTSMVDDLALAVNLTVSLLLGLAMSICIVKCAL
jgi:hypothetical protein